MLGIGFYVTRSTEATEIHAKCLAEQRRAELADKIPSSPQVDAFKFNRFWLKTVEPTLKIEQNVEMQRRLSLQVRENVELLKRQLSSLCTNGSPAEVRTRFEELKTALTGVTTKTCKTCLDELANSIPRQDPLAKYSGDEKPDEKWFSAVSNLLEIADSTARLLWIYAGDCRGAACLDSWTLNILDLWRRDFRSRKWFEGAEIIRQIFEKRVAACYDGESSYVKIACGEYDIEKDFKGPRIEGRCSMFNNREIAPFLKLLKRPPRWARRDRDRLKEETGCPKY